MIDDDLIGLDGTDLIDDDGNDLLVDADGNLCLCGCGEEPHYICGSDNTCNKYCEPTKKAFSRGYDCPCPCDNRRAYPEEYNWTWDIVISTGPFPTTHFSPGGYMIVTAGASATFTNCDVAAHEVTQEFYDSDGNLEATETNTLNASINNPTSDCGRKINIIGNVFWGVNIPGGDPAVATVDITVDRCNGGSGAGSAGPNPAGSSGGTFTYTPACENCDGSPVSIGTDPASLCGGHIQIVVNIWDAVLMMNVVHTFDLFGGPNAWDGDDGEGNTAHIRNRGTEDAAEIASSRKCCAPHDARDECDCPDGTVCDECWTLTIDVDDCEYEFHSFGPCPSAGTYIGATGLDCPDLSGSGGDGISIDSFSYLDGDCP